MCGEEQQHPNDQRREQPRRVCGPLGEVVRNAVLYQDMARRKKDIASRRKAANIA
jgi:hypothetical protein